MLIKPSKPKQLLHCFYSVKSIFHQTFDVYQLRYEIVKLATLLHSSKPKELRLLPKSFTSNQEVQSLLKSIYLDDIYDDDITYLQYYFNETLWTHNSKNY